MTSYHDVVSLSHPREHYMKTGLRFGIPAHPSLTILFRYNTKLYIVVRRDSEPIPKIGFKTRCWVLQKNYYFWRQNTWHDKTSSQAYVMSLSTAGNCILSNESSPLFWWKVETFDHNTIVISVLFLLTWKPTLHRGDTNLQDLWKPHFRVCTSLMKGHEPK